MTRWISVSLSSLLLLLLLTACGGGGSSNATTPTASPATPTPTATPTQAAQAQTYTGTGFTIQYPQGWKAQPSQSGGVVFTDPQQLNALTIFFLPNPGGAVSASQQADAGLITAEKTGGLSQPQPVSLPATTTVAGESWAQRGVTGNVTSNGVTAPAEIILLANNHPANAPTTRTYEIYYGGPAVSFQQESLLVFQPMLQSFKYTA